MRHCLHVDHRLIKYERILYRLFLVKIPTEYHIKVSKVFGLSNISLLSGRKCDLLKGINNAEWIVVPPALYETFPIYELHIK
jgi:hypothetical protein